jgi:hypothetical protein
MCRTVALEGGEGDRVSSWLLSCWRQFCGRSTMKMEGRYKQRWGQQRQEQCWGASKVDKGLSR